MKYVENYESSWKYVLDFYLKNVGGKFLFQCNFDHRTLSIILPIFYRECLQAWVYNEFRSLKQTPATAKAKILNKYPDLPIDWKKLYSLAFETTLDTKLREF